MNPVDLGPDNPVPSMLCVTAHNGSSGRTNSLGMRPMQERAYEKRHCKYLLIKSPPASGKSRALMYIALDKVLRQGLKQVIVVVPERSIGASFSDEPLTQTGFWADWRVPSKWNLCNAPGADDGVAGMSKVQALRDFLASSDIAAVCTHATFRFACEKFEDNAWDGRLIAIDEFHHVSSSSGSVLGSRVTQLLDRGATHLIAMTGSYFRGDGAAVLSPHDEQRFETVTYTYYEQLNGYTYLKSLGIGYYFYTGRYIDAIAKVLDPALKTIVHIPNVQARESLKDKHREVDEIMCHIGQWSGRDADTGFHLIRGQDGRLLRVADLVDDSDESARTKVLTALRDPLHKDKRDHVDIIIALGMAKEGFDWIWCEHALTIGYRSSLTEIVQIIGRATRDAPGKSSARFTNLIAEPDVEQGQVVAAVNDTLKAIAASLLMEQVLSPRFEFSPKADGPREGYDYGPNGYDPNLPNLGVKESGGHCHVEIAGIAMPETPDAARICREDINEVVTAFIQDKTTLERGLFDSGNTPPEEITQVRMGKIVRDRFPTLSEADQEAVRQHAIAALILVQQSKKYPSSSLDEIAGRGGNSIVEGARRFLDVCDLDIDLIDHINPFEAAYAVLSKAMGEQVLRQVQASIASRRVAIPIEEARELARRALQFKDDRGRAPSLSASDAWEKRMAEGVVALARYRSQQRASQSQGENHAGN